jgi:hypothetical protein
VARGVRGELAERALVREQPDFSTRPRPRRLPTRHLVAFVGGLLVLALAVRIAWTARHEAEAARERLAEVEREVVSLGARLRAFGDRGARGEDLARAAAVAEAPPERIVATLARALPDDARVEQLSIVYGNEISLEMRVVARSPAAWDRTLERLEETAALDEVSPGPEKREGEVRTTVRALWARRVR